MAKKSVSKPPKGTRDFLPADIRKREYVAGVIRRIYRQHGFEPLETPTFERLDALLGKYGDEGDQLVFKILHRGQNLVKGIRKSAEYLQEDDAIVVGRSGETAPGAETMLSDMGLRYDLTVPLARVYAEYGGKLPTVFKRFQIQPVWRADNPGKGRFREFYQCDVDVVGSKSLTVEAEVVGAVAQCLKELGFADFEIRLNHRALLRAFIEVSGIDASLETEAIVAIDKFDKIGEEGVKKELSAKGIEGEAQEKLMRLVFGEASLERLTEELSGHEAGLAAIEELKEVLSLSSCTPAGGVLKFNPTLARGLGYYTGCIFEIAVADLAGSLGGGGRYDGLIGMFSGREVPACGFSIGLERILVVMEQRGMFPELGSSAEVLVVSTEKDRVAEALALSYRLRAQGLWVSTHPKADKPGKIRKLAAETGIPKVVFVRREGEPLNLWDQAEPDNTHRTVEEAELAAALKSE